MWLEILFYLSTNEFIFSSDLSWMQIFLQWASHKLTTRKVRYTLVQGFSMKENFDKISDRWKCPFVKNSLLLRKKGSPLRSFCSQNFSKKSCKYDFFVKSSNNFVCVYWSLFFEYQRKIFIFGGSSSMPKGGDHALRHWSLTLYWMTQQTEAKKSATWNDIIGK